ncbi:MAG: T9SS type A sorting domain-containing protein [bacterium]|nr:T9SS type A sorting domain-containing protein [bacterium]
MKTTFITSTLKAALLLVLPMNVAYSATVSANASTGSDISGDGTSGNPYQTFHTAYTNASEGDTILLYGTFDWTNTDETGDAAATGYSLLKSLTIIGEGAGLTFIQSAATSGTADRCVFTINDDITFENLTIRNGYNTNQGHNAGAITVMDDIRDNIVTLNSCIIEDNGIDNGSSGGYYYFAGGIYLRGNTSFHPDLRLNDCTFRNNTANGQAYGAGALYSMQSNTVTINRCTFNGNSGTDGSSFGIGYHNVAGAIGFFRFNTVEVTNSTFTANSAESSGGAILSWYNRTYLTNNTIAYNSVTSASGKGGGVYVVFMQQSPGNLYLRNNIIAQNTVNGAAEDLNFNTDSWASNIHDNGTNIIETFDGSSITPSGTGTITGIQANLHLSSTLATNSATNGVMTLALSTGSVAIDAGSDGTNGTVTVPTYDQRNFVRSSTLDIGAYEFNGSGLPVELVSFGAALTTENTVDLNWQTASEKDNDRFEIYRSIDGVEWSLIHTEKGTGTTSNAQFYTAEDRNPYKGVNYYQLKQIDFNGASETFDIVRVEVEALNEVRLYPNPAKDHISLSDVGSGYWAITDFSGRVFLEGTANISESMNVSSLEPGSYLFRVNGAVYPFVKQ